MPKDEKRNKIKNYRYFFSFVFYYLFEMQEFQKKF